MWHGEMGTGTGGGCQGVLVVAMEDDLALLLMISMHAIDGDW